MHHLVTVSDLDDAAIERFRALSRDAAPGAGRASGLHVGLVFLEPSLRTRIGFATAAVRLGGSYVEVTEQRWEAGMSESEAVGDVVRVVSGMTDVLVLRTSLPASGLVSASVAPVINGGDGGDGCEHPTQALIDLVAMERFRGPIGALHVAICGDLRMRAVRSLVRLLGRVPPARLTLVAPAGREDFGMMLPEPLAPRVTRTHVLDPASFDVLYLAGLPEGDGPSRLTRIQRAPYTLTAEVLARLPAASVVLSPMPVIDEISPALRDDPRMRLFDTTDLSVAVRMEVLMLASSR